jgi:ParB family chromosome partitioning protein
LLPAAFEEELQSKASEPPRGQAPSKKGTESARAEIPSVARATTPNAAHTPAEERAYFFADIESISPSAEQPRKHFDSVALDELAQSIRTHGILSPIVVRRKGLSFEIIAGERRWRAAKQAGLTKVPVILKEVGEKAQYQLALVENIQRKDLTPIEEAIGYEHLMEAYGWTQEKVAEQVGKERASVANALRLLKLPQPVIDLINEGKISAGHAKALVSLPDQESIKECARKVVDEGWSVRMVENHTRLHKPKKPMATTARPTVHQIHLKELERKFEAKLGVAVAIQGSEKRGEIRVRYESTEELNRLADQMGVL